MITANPAFKRKQLHLLRSNALRFVDAIAIITDYEWRNADKSKKEKIRKIIKIIMEADNAGL